MVTRERVEEPTGVGTRLTVVETGFAQMPDAEAVARQIFAALTRDWDGALGSLKDHLDQTAADPEKKGSTP